MIDRSVVLPIKNEETSVYVDNWDSSTAGNSKDLLIGNANSNTLRAGDGNDFLYGGGGSDILDGGKHNDFLSGDDGIDQLIGGADNDTLRGGSEGDTLYGDLENKNDATVLGNDELYGEDGNDALYGGGGNDLLDGGADADRLEGGKGYDTYKADDKDTILDTDGKGRVILNNNKLGTAIRKKGETIYKDANGNYYFLAGTKLVINGGLVILGYTNGDLEIKLIDEDNPWTAPINKAQSNGSPIVLDLDGNGIATTAVTDRHLYFDLDNNGFAERTGWIGAGDGFLVRDKNADGKIDNGDELFGNHTWMKDGTLAINGYAALADLDDNGDGRIDSQDAVFNQLRIWQDTDGDGFSQSGELRSLAAHGIRQLNIGYNPGTITDAQGNGHLQIGS